MNLWKIRPLAKQLSANQVSEILGMRYFSASSLPVLFATYYSLWWGVLRDWLFYFEFVVLSVITVFGCYKAFEANGGREGDSFVLKAVCLSVPIGIRVNVISIAFGLSLYFSFGNIISFTSFGDPYGAYTIMGYTGFVGFSIYFWWLLVEGIKDSQSPDNQHNNRMQSDAAKAAPLI